MTHTRLNALSIFIALVLAVVLTGALIWLDRAWSLAHGGLW